jgi:hypothetical protein
MKLHKQLTLNGEPLLLVSDDVRLFLFSPGCAAFNVNQGAAITGGIVQFSMGYDLAKLDIMFTGVIENSFAIDKKQQTLFCRELTKTINRILPLALRNCTLKNVLTEISKETALKFSIPDKTYANTAAPVFYSVGTGYHAMDALARIFQIPKMLWQQQGDGKIFVGSWDDSFFVGKPVPVPVDMRSKSGLANSATLASIPKFRPGVLLSTGEIITSVHFSDVHMHIQWDKNPWGTRWINKSTVS